jgi:hypothetical protein
MVPGRVAPRDEELHHGGHTQNINAAGVLAAISAYEGFLSFWWWGGRPDPLHEDRQRWFLGNKELAWKGESGDDSRWLSGHLVPAALLTLLAPRSDVLSKTSTLNVWI